MFRKIGSILLVCIGLVIFTASAQEIIIKNDQVQRVLKYDGKVWRTTKFTGANSSVTLSIQSDEFHILPMNGNKGLTISNFNAAAPPSLYTNQDTSFCEISYLPLAAAIKNEACPKTLVVSYFAVKGQPFIRKKIQLVFDKPSTVDRLEVERFVNVNGQTGGGRGEPVFIKNQWFVGLEYPAAYSRRGNGNLPASYGRYYDSVGNYSFIDLEGRDIEPNGQKGMVRLMHFPGYATGADGHYEIRSKPAVAGFARPGTNVQEGFMTYLSTLWKEPRSFVNYNNWFDRSAKDLRGDTFINVYKRYEAAIQSYGIKIDAMVPDDGWQDRNSIWKPSPRYFPNGDDDLVLLSKKLQQAGTKLGLWLSLNSYNGNIDWGLKNGYNEAGRNNYFKSYGRYYSLSATKYKKEVLKRIPEIAKKAGIIYFKHDFNNLNDIAEGNNHPATDRHGHEANLDVALTLLSETRKVQPQIFQNLTNWIWFSPWWLQYADYLWMLAGDDGMNGNTPELSEKAMFTTDRDTYIWRMFGNPADRPLVPVSRLMTHGILHTKTSEKNISIQDWNDYIIMHYGRGTLLKEWYISLDAMRPELWQSLARVQKWAERHEKALNNAVFVGGRPDEGNVYGYMGWEKDKGILTVRNAGAGNQKIIIPFNASTGFYGAARQSYRARVTYPYEEVYPVGFTSGNNIQIEVPGYATMVLEIEKGQVPAVKSSLPGIIQFQTINKDQTVKINLAVPGDVKTRCDLLIIGYPELPVISIDGKPVQAEQTSKAKLNNFASYAVAGMNSNKAVDWNMTGYDLLPYAGKKIEITYSAAASKFNAYLLAERNAKASKPAPGDKSLPVTNDIRRQTIKLY